MHKSFFTALFRNLLRYRGYAIINILGLTLGLTCSLLLIYHVINEISYDRTFSSSGRIFRVINTGKSESDLKWAVTSPPLGLNIQDQIPEIESVVRMRYLYPTVLGTEDEKGNIVQFEELNGYYADSTIFEFFNLKTLAGNADHPFCEPNSVVLTRSIAEKYFGDSDPIGKTITDKNQDRLLQVTAVIADLPFNTHLNFDFLIPMSVFYDQMSTRGAAPWLENRGWAAMYTYVMLNKHYDVNDIQPKLRDFILDFFQEWGSEDEILSRLDFQFQPIWAIHLHSHLEQEMQLNSNIIYVIVYIVIACLFLIVSSFNFINISLALSLRRLKEIGMKRILGAGKSHIILQFMVEAAFLVILAALLAVAFIELLEPCYSLFTGHNLYQGNFVQFKNMIVLVIILLSLITASGLFPAIYVSHVKPILALNVLRIPKTAITSIRKSLLIFQFLVSSFLIFCSLVIYSQLQYLGEKDPGFDKEHIVAVQLFGTTRQEVNQKPEFIKSEISKNPLIRGITTASTLPGDRFSVESLWIHGRPDSVEVPPVRFLRVDHNFLNTMDISLVKGRDFVPGSTEYTQFILNETAVGLLNLENPVGLRAENRLFDAKGEIIGVVEDFNYASLHHPIEALVMYYQPYRSNYLLVKFDENEYQAVMQHISSVFNKIVPGNYLKYVFLDEKLNNLYAVEDRLMNVFVAFAVVTVLISCLGLFGMASLTAEQRTKEIGIRKVLGSSVSGICILLARDYTRWVLVANALALPAAWFVMSKWLDNFAYHVNMSFFLIFFSVVITFLLVLATASLRSLSIASLNPIQTIRYE